MIHHPISSEESLVDRELLAAVLGLSVASIRRHCEPIACDVETHRVLYACNIRDPRGASEALRDVAPRQKRTKHGRVSPVAA